MSGWAAVRPGATRGDACSAAEGRHPSMRRQATAFWSNACMRHQAAQGQAAGCTTPRMSLCPAQTPGADPHTVGEGEEGSEEGAEGEEEALKEQKPPGVLSSVKSIALAHLQGRKQADSQLIEGQCYGGSNITSRTTRARSSTAPPHPPPPPTPRGPARKKKERTRSAPATRSCR